MQKIKKTSFFLATLRTKAYTILRNETKRNEIGSDEIKQKE